MSVVYSVTQGPFIHQTHRQPALGCMTRGRLYDGASYDSRLDGSGPVV